MGKLNKLEAWANQVGQTSLFEMLSGEKPLCERLDCLPVTGEALDFANDTTMYETRCADCGRLFSPIEVDKWKKEIGSYPSLLGGEDNPLAHI